jgi:hypothetical protein
VRAFAVAVRGEVVAWAASVRVGSDMAAGCAGGRGWRRDPRRQGVRARDSVGSAGGSPRGQGSGAARRARPGRQGSGARAGSAEAAHVAHAGGIAGVRGRPRGGIRGGSPRRARRRNRGGEQPSARGIRGGSPRRARPRNHGGESRWVGGGG